MNILFHKVSVFFCFFIVSVSIAGCDVHLKNNGERSDFSTEKSGETSDFSKKNSAEASKASKENNEETLDPGDKMEDPDTNMISVDVTAENVVVIQADTNAVLYQKNSMEKIAPASTAKMIMALTALDFCLEQDQVTVGAEIGMIHPDSSRAWLNEGDILTLKQLLIALLLPSGNDAAYSLAVYTGRKIAGDGSLSAEQAVERFMDAVNNKAAELGAENSYFVVPDGYDAAGQYTTAHDLAVIAKACLCNECMMEIMACDKSYEKWVSGREVTYYNTNKLLDSNSEFYYPQVIGMKTGTSSLAGASLISAAVIEEQTYISVVMKAAAEDDRFSDSIHIYNAIQNDTRE